MKIMKEMNANYLPVKCKGRFSHLNLMFAYSFHYLRIKEEFLEQKICLGQYLTAASVAEVTRSNKMSHKMSQKARPRRKIKE